MPFVEVVGKEKVPLAHIAGICVKVGLVLAVNVMVILSVSKQPFALVPVYVYVPAAVTVKFAVLETVVDPLLHEAAVPPTPVKEI